MSAADFDALPRVAANHQPLTPLLFVERAAATFPDRVAVIHGALSWTWREHRDRCVRLASALFRRGIGRGDVVAAILPNTAPMLECHGGVPMSGAVLNSINTRLDAGTVAFILDHGAARLVVVDREFVPLLERALALCAGRPEVVVVDDPQAPFPGAGEGLGWEALLAEGDPGFAWPMPADEWDAIALNYTSGTTGRPKGVVCHHRGAHLIALGNVLACGIGSAPVLLWTLPMFHCNGWCFPWVMAAVAGTQVCLRQVRAAAMWEAIDRHGVDLMCGAPVVLSTLVEAPRDAPAGPGGGLRFLVAGAPPPEAVLAAADRAGVRVVHGYGLTETYGPAVVNPFDPTRAGADPGGRAALMARQGVRYVTLEGLEVLDAEGVPVAPDGATMGEVAMRGNVVMKGYLRDPDATAKAFAGGWFRSGDLGVRHPDGTVQLRDRAKDIIISGGENVSSIEVEEALYRHPAVALAAVVAMADPRWGEVPCAFVELREGARADEAEIVAFCRERLAGFKTPRRVVFGELPRTATGKIQKVRLRDGLRDGSVG